MTLPPLTPCQQSALHVLLGSTNVFLTGAAGTGKSHLLRLYLSAHDPKTHPILASTGAAAMLVGGRTFHSFFGLGICEGGRAATVKRATSDKRTIRRIQHTECVVIDEVSMLSGETLATAEEIARVSRESFQPWGGLRIIAVGDFAQLPPVQDRGTKKDWAFLHPVWQASELQPAFLQTPVRTQEPRLLSVLRAVREGIVNQEVEAFLEERMRPAATEKKQDATHLFPHRSSAEKYNMQRLSALPGTITTIETQYSGRRDAIKKLQQQCPIPDTLCLKPGALVMTRKNDTTYPHAYVNGSLGTIQQIDEECLQISLLNSETIDLYKDEFHLLDGNGRPLASAYNFPITLAWATTIHKAQGASIDELVVNMTHLWEPGHAYVALSRARTEAGLHITAWDHSSISVDPDVTVLYADIKEQWKETVRHLPQDPPVLPTPNKQEKLPKKSTIPNHLQTLALLNKGMPLTEIAAQLGWKVSTIIGHIERLQKEGADLNIAYLRPSDGFLKPIENALRTAEGYALKPIFEQFNGTYSYDDLKLARLFVQ